MMRVHVCVQLTPPFENGDYKLLEYDKSKLKEGQPVAHYFNEVGWMVGKISKVRAQP